MPNYCEKLFLRRDIFYNGVLVDTSGYKPNNYEYINGGVICLCGKFIQCVHTLITHKKTKEHFARLNNTFKE